ncbi:MAG TPA: TonB family protein [Longimicrobiaceae bacterium]|nr:TonB family protein [Longimicrobiaceae bacterium]
MGSVPPTVDLLVDSAALVEAIGEMQGESSGYAISSVSTDSTGAIDDIWIVEESLGDTSSSQILAAITDAARTQTPGSSSTTLLRIDLGDQIRLRTGRSEECRPAMTNREAFAQALTARVAELARTRNFVPGQTYTSLVWVYVNAEGDVEQIRLREGSRRAEFDRLAISFAPEWEFHPALMNRKPVAVWVAVPVSIRVPPRQSPRRPGPG